MMPAASAFSAQKYNKEEKAKQFFYSLMQSNLI